MKIVISGYYGHGNIGDEAILFSIAEQLREHDLTVVSLDPGYTKKVQGLKAIDFFNPEEVEEQIKQSDIVIMGGGGLFQEIPDIDYYRVKVSLFLDNPYGKPDGKLAAYAIVPIIAAFYNKPLIFLAHGIGPFYSDDNKAFYRFIFSLSSLITVRDHYSLSWVKKLCKKKTVHLSADPTFLLKPKYDEKISNLFNKYNLTERGFITLSLRDMVHNELSENIIKEVAHALNTFLKGNKLKVLFIPFQNTKKVGYPTDDVKIALQLIGKLDDALRERMVILEDNFYPQEILALLDKSLFGIGMRYHFLVFSILNHRPVISISYSEKCNSVMKETGLGELSINIFHLTQRELESRINRVFNNLDAYQKIISSNISEMKQRALYSFTLVNHINNLKSAVDENKEYIIEEKVDDLEDKNRIIEALRAKLAEKDKIITGTQDKLNSILKSKTWRLGQLYGRLFYKTRVNKIFEGLFEIFSKKDSSSLFSDNNFMNGETIKKLQNIIHFINQKDKKGVFIITSAFEFDEIYNQRVINLSKYLANENYSIIYIAWRWSKDHCINGSCEEVYPNIFQVPVDYFFDHYDLFTNLVSPKKCFVIEFPHPDFFTIMLHFKEAGFILLYDIIDEWEEFYKVDQAPWFKKDYEEAIVLNADVLTAVSVPLIEKFSALRSDISLVPNGFSSVFLGEKENVSGLNKKNVNKIDIGYFGYLTQSWFDWDVVFAAAEKNSDFIFHIIGYGESEEIKSKVSKYKNLTLYGKVHPSELHRYAKDWDVAILPFKKNALNKAVDPIKIYEYLYFGLPTVVQGIDHLESLPYVKVSNSPVEFEDAIKEFAEEKKSRSISYKEIAAFLEGCSWEKRFASMLKLLERKSI